MDAAILVALFAMSAVDADADDEMPTVMVRLENLEPISTGDVDFAESRAAAVFRRIGVHVRWIHEEAAVRDHVRPPFTVILIKTGPDSTVRPGIVDALGFADPSVSRAHVIYDRVEALAARTQFSAASLLGDVMAHELGHLMLPGPAHTTRGIMRPGVDVHVHPMETFTGPQRRQIVSRLTRNP